MKKIVVFILLNCVIACGVNSKKIVGKYYTAKPDIISIVELRDNGKFIYTFERDSFCSGKIEGNYKIENKKIKFVNDYEYSEAYQQKIIDSLNLNSNDTVSYDIAFLEFEMGLVDWKLKSNYIQPEKIIEMSCFTIEGKHNKNTR